MRKPSACDVCRTRRRRCTYPDAVSDTTAAVCEYCSIHGLECVQKAPPGGWYHRRQLRAEARARTGVSPPVPWSDIPGPRRPEPQALAPAPSVNVTPEYRVAYSPVTTVLSHMPMAEKLELVNLYFDYIHDQFHSLFHRPTFMQQVERNEVEEIILLAIFALSVRYSSRPLFSDAEPRGRGERFRVPCERLLNIRDISLVTVQVCVLLGAYAAGEGEIEAENVYYTMAGRMACTMRLTERPVASELEKEKNTRVAGSVWWSLCMIDVWSSTAVKLPRMMPAALQSGVDLPMDELPFLSLQFQPSPQERRTPLLAEMVRLNKVLANIIDFNKRCVAQRLAGPALEAGVQSLALELEHWLVTLPSSLADTPSNLEWFASRGLGRMFAAIYLGYYYFAQLLYFQFLGADSMLPAHIVYAERCKDAARALCDFTYRCAATPGADVRYPAVAHVLVIASTVQIHTLLFSTSERQIGEARERLERNFQMIQALRPYWPAVDGAMSRLRAFHQTCLRRASGSGSPGGSSAFVLDQWLLRFLVEFATHMEDEPREADPEYQELWSLSVQGPRMVH